MVKVTIKNWHAVATWTWTSEDDVCGICHMALDGCAPGASGPGDDSPVVWGRVCVPHPTAMRAPPLSFMRLTDRSVHITFI